MAGVQKCGTLVAPYFPIDVSFCYFLTQRASR